MGTLASAVTLFCVVTVHQQAQQGSGNMQAHAQDMKQSRMKQSRFPVWVQGQTMTQCRLPVLVKMAVWFPQQLAVQIIQQMTSQRQNKQTPLADANASSCP